MRFMPIVVTILLVLAALACEAGRATNKKAAATPKDDDGKYARRWEGGIRRRA